MLIEKVERSWEQECCSSPSMQFPCSIRLALSLAWVLTRLLRTYAKDIVRGLGLPYFCDTLHPSTLI